MGIDAIALYILKKLDSTDNCLFHLGFREIGILKWHNVINLNSWFLAISKKVSDFPFQANFFFLKLSKILTKIDISCVKS